MKKTKVFGVGYHKTGTTTLGICLKQLGYYHQSSSREAFLVYHENGAAPLIPVLKYFDSFEDWPWPLMYREIYDAYPDAKYVLTVREDPEVWFQSVNRHVKRGAGDNFKFRQYIYGEEFPEKAREKYLNQYHAHNAAVRKFFIEQNADFIELCWERGDGWNELCQFLEEPVPKAPFPHANRDPSRIKSSLGRRVLGKAKRVIKGA
jgi:hypothetical protein